MVPRASGIHSRACEEIARAGGSCWRAVIRKVVCLDLCFISLRLPCENELEMGESLSEDLSEEALRIFKR